MPVPPQRGSAWNPIGDIVGRAREIAGRSGGGSLTQEARRIGGGSSTRAAWGTGSWREQSEADPVADAGHTAVTSSLSGLVVGGPRRMGDFRVSLSGWNPATAGGRVNVNFGATLISSGGAHITDNGQAVLSFRWWIGGGAPWDPLPPIQIGFPATPLTNSPTVRVTLAYELTS